MIDVRTAIHPPFSAAAWLSIRPLPESGMQATREHEEQPSGSAIGFVCLMGLSICCPGQVSLAAPFLDRVTYPNEGKQDGKEGRQEKGKQD